MMKYDTNCDGIFGIPEVKAIISDLNQAHSLAKNLVRALLVGCVGFLVFCGVQAWLMYTMVRASRPPASRRALCLPPALVRPPPDRPRWSVGAGQYPGSAGGRFRF